MEAKGAALMLPFANTRAMQMHLDEISCNVAAKAHGVVLMDRAGWHSTDKLKVPKNLTIILLPSRSPELVNGGAKLVHPGGAKLVHLTLCGTRCWGVVPVVHRRDPRCFV